MQHWSRGVTRGNNMENQELSREIAAVNEPIAEGARVTELVKEPIDTGHLVRIHIDREAYESPSLTTGEALYELAHIPAYRELFREVGVTMRTLWYRATPRRSV